LPRATFLLVKWVESFEGMQEPEAESVSFPDFKGNLKLSGFFWRKLAVL